MEASPAMSSNAIRPGRRADHRLVGGGRVSGSPGEQSGGWRRCNARLASGGGARRRLASGEWRRSAGEWRVATLGWRVAARGDGGGEWRAAGGVARGRLASGGGEGRRRAAAWRRRQRRRRAPHAAGRADLVLGGPRERPAVDSAPAGTSTPPKSPPVVRRSLPHRPDRPGQRREIALREAQVPDRGRRSGRPRRGTSRPGSCP